MENDLKPLLVEAEHFLNRDPLANWYALSRIASGMVSECDIQSGAIRLFDSENSKHLYSADSFQSFKPLYDRVSNRPGSNVSLVTTADYMQEVLDMDTTLRANPFHQLLATAELPIEPISGVAFMPIDGSAIDWILSVYHHPELNHAFITYRMKHSPTVLATMDGAPVGFIMSHCDAEIGPVYVVPQLRGTGLATQLFARIMDGFTKQGIRPGMFVAMANMRSLAWLKKIGCKELTGKALWFWRETTSPS